MIRLDKNEFLIVRELIKNPRISDNQIAKRTGIPVMTVNRKRKALEQKGRLFYFTRLATEDETTKEYSARQLYIIKFKVGITKEQYLETIRKSTRLADFYSQHIVESWIGEKDGLLALVIVVEAKTEGELIECFNGKIVPELKQRFGEDCIREVFTTKIISVIRQHHNYIPSVNMENGILKKDWLDEWIYVSRDIPE